MYILDPQRARDEKRAVTDIVRLAGENVHAAEVQRPVERGGQRGGGAILSEMESGCGSGNGSVREEEEGSELSPRA